MKRCSWCGRFVGADTAITCWRVAVGRAQRQIPRSQWNYWCRMLCPDCATSVDGGVWKSVPPALAVKRRPKIAAGRGWTA
jgi:hypothetical protein